MPKNAPYQHADGSNCWTKDCTRRITENTLRQKWANAITSGDKDAIHLARKAYLSTESGVAELRKAGKTKLADAYDRLRKTRATRALRNRLAERKPTVLALDLDQTTGDFVKGLRDHLAKKEGLTAEEALAKYPEPTNYDLTESGWFSSSEEFLDAFHSAEKEGLYRELNAFEGARKTLTKLVQNRDVTIVVVTARDQKWNDDTRTWLKKQRIPASRIIHTEDKEKVTGVDVYIDDSPKQLTTLSAHGRTVIAFNNRYNEHVKVPHRVRSWSQVPATLRHLRHGNNE